MQLTELREFASKRGWEVVGEFVDVGVSGSKDHRPQLDAMMRLAKARMARAMASLSAKVKARARRKAGII